MNGVMTALGFVIALAAPAAAQPSRCADCHYADRAAPEGWHRDQWALSPHGRAGVGCDRCHGGNPGTYDPLVAHRGVQQAEAPTSPVNAANLPATCGGCHLGPYIAFQESWHFQMLRTGDLRGPSCDTCHGDVEGYRLSPRNLERQCAECHGPDGVAPRADRAREARVLLESIREMRGRLAAARVAIRREPAARRSGLETHARQVEVVLVEATEAIHRFAFARSQDALDTARQRVTLLEEALAPRAGAR